MIIADADFLSAFLKIDQLNLVFTALETKEIVVTEAVLDELKQAPVYEKLLRALSSENEKIVVKKVKAVRSENLGRGELESITLAKNTSSLLLMDDRKAAKFAEGEGVTVMDVPIFLLHCKTGNFVSSAKIKEIIGQLKEKDYYEFSEEVKETLIGS